jgi:regulator of sirC expression with transglutaminase-like and TPR domain
MEILDLSTDHPARRALSELADRDDEAIDLARGALLIAAEDMEAESYDVDAYGQRIEDLARRVEGHLPDEVVTADRIAAVHQVLFCEMRFQGDELDYYHPDNALLPRVLDRRRGLPISLAVIYVAVARRCGIEAAGVAFPGHFLVRCEVEEGIVVVDPFHGGRTLDIADCRRLLSETTGSDVEFDPDLLTPASPRAVLTRILANLRAMYLRRADEARALRAHERMVLLNPRSASLLRGRAALYSRLGRADRAATDLEHFLTLAPAPEEAAEARRELARLRSGGRWVN